MATFTPGDSGFTTLTDNLEALYVGYFGRAAEQQGLTFWSNAINSGQASLASVEAFFVLQPEALAKYPFLASPSVTSIDPFINSIFQGLFNHPADPQGLAFWHNYLAANINNSFAVGQFIGFIINGAQGTDATIMTNKVTVADFNTSTFAAAGITQFDSTTAAGKASIAAIASVDATPASVTAAEAAITAFVKAPPPPNFSIVDIIPNSQSFFDIFQNSEPSIAVNPMNPMQMVAAAFGAAPSGPGAPFFVSTDGGTTWSPFGAIPHGDTSLAWSLDGSKVLGTTLTTAGGDPDSGSTINTFSSTVANMNFGNAINMFPPTGPTRGLDQPWIEIGPANQVYVGYNGPSSPTVPGATATILISSDGGNTYGATIALDRVGGPLQDDPSVREAVNNNTVYAVFDRWTSNISNNTDGAQYASQLVVEKSLNAGADGFKALGADGNGVVVATPNVPFAGPAVGNPAASNTVLTFGQNRSDIGTAIAVNPSNPNDVVVAYSNVTKYVPGHDIPMHERSSD